MTGEQSVQGVSPAGLANHAIAVVIPAYEKSALVARAVACVLASTGVTLDIVIVNNSPGMALAEIVESDAAGRVRVIEMGHNSGFVGAINAGIAASQAPHILFLNQDAELTPTYLPLLAAFLELHPDAAAASGKVLRLGGDGTVRTKKFDSAGITLRRGRGPFDRAEGATDHGQLDLAEEVFAVSGAAPLVRRKALEDVSAAGQYLDPALFMYKEDIDLCWRFRRRGWACWYVPEAVAYHARSSRALAGQSYLKRPWQYLKAVRRRSDRARMYSMRNQWLILVKNEDVRVALRDLPWIGARETLVVGATFLTSPRAALRAVATFIPALPGALRERRRLQRSAVVSNAELRHRFIL